MRGQSRDESVSMMRVIATCAVLSAVAASVGGCGYADANATFVPEMLRYKTTVPQPEIIPDVKAMLRENPANVFSTRAPPKNIQVSVPRRKPSGPGWTACVRAEVAGVTGRSIGVKTYLLSIDQGAIGDRRLADDSSGCGSETYEPV